MTFLGVGTKFYGKSGYNYEDRSYITTKWFSLNLIPLFPIKSYRVIKQLKPKEKSFRLVLMALDSLVPGIENNLRRYKILEEISLKNNVKQFLITYGFYYGGIGLCVSSYFIAPLISVFLVPIYIIAVFLNSKN